LLGQPVIVETASAAAAQLRRSSSRNRRPTVTSVLLMPAADAVQPAVRRKLPYDLERDLAPVGRIALGPWVVVVNPSVPGAHGPGIDCACARQTGQT
jgi:tripartite-type tricarboxylate transporter receptor subunit TctC